MSPATAPRRDQRRRVTPGPDSQFPALPPRWLARERLHARLTSAIAQPVTTVAGPPGSGKTVLLSGWAQHGAPPVAWLSADQSDNDSSRFWPRLTEAVQAVDAGLAASLRGARVRGARVRGAAGPGARVRGPQARGPESGGRRPGASVVGAKVPPAPPEGRPGRRHQDDSRSATTPPIVLIVDDVHLLGPESIRALGSLIADLPPRLRLILAGRDLTVLPLEAWRGPTGWAEVDSRDLRFTSDEAVAWLSSPGSSPLPDDTARALADRTEGWAAGLRLAAVMSPLLADGTTLLDTFTGEARLLVEYFNRELIEHRPAPQVRFLLASSALDRLTAEACTAVTGRSDAAALLETLCRQHALLEQWDPAVPSYRYHPLFHEFLRHKLRTEAPAIARLAHLRGAAWCKSQADDQAAARHLIAAGSHHEAFVLGLKAVVRRLDGRYLPGDAELAMAELPRRFVDQDPFRIYAVAAAHLADLRPREAAGRLRALERLSREWSDRTSLQGRAELLWTFRAALTADPAGVLSHFQRAVELDRSGHLAQPDGEGGPPSDSARAVQALDEVLWRHLRPLAAAAGVCLDTGPEVDRPEVDRPELDRPDVARATPRDIAGDTESVDDGSRLSVAARVAYHEGHLQEARQLADQALEEGWRSGRTGSVSTLHALRTLAAVLYERDDLDESAARLRDARQLCRAASLGHWRAALAGDEARILVARGAAPSALDLLEQARGGGYDDPLPGPLRQHLDRVEIRGRLALGDLEGARHLARSLPAPARTVEILARLDLAAGRPDRAAERLTAGDQNWRRRIEIERLLLLSRACRQLGDETRCTAAVQRAVVQARPDRFIRVFVDEAADLAGSLTRISARTGDPFVAELVAHGASRPPGPGPASLGVLEPFTTRERELLSYLPSHLSQHEIAAVMDISLNTVKTHTKAVYRKLGATCRSEAVDAARAHGLL